MAGEPDVGIGVQVRHIGVEVECRAVVPVLIVHRLDNAGHVGGKRRGLAVTDLAPEIRAPLATAATEEQVVVQLVIGRGPRAVKQGGRGALERNDDCAVRLVRINVTPEPVLSPAKAR